MLSVSLTAHHGRVQRSFFEAGARGPLLKTLITTAIAVFGVLLAELYLSGDPEQEYFADGIADDIHTALAKSRWLFVMGRSSAFAFRGKALELDEVARKLGVRYVLSGSVRRSSSKVRVAAQLIEAETGESIWAEHYDSDLTDILQMQDEITEAVAAAIEPQLIRKESERGVQRSQNLTAWDLVRRGMWHFHRFTPENHELAREFFVQATSVEPNEASGYIWLARTESSRLTFLGTPDRDESLRVALQAAQKAVQIDPQNPYSHYAVAVAYLGGSEFENSVRAAQQAVRLNPSFALANCQLGASTLHCDGPQDAVDLLERGLRLSPFDPQNFVWLFFLACAYCLSQQPEKGLVAARRALDLRPNWASGLKILAANALAAGQERQALAAWQQAAVAADQTGDLIGMMKRSHPGWVADVERKFQQIGN
jgi:adenylate cyclase